MLKHQKTMVMIIGHKDPHYLIDTAESIKFYNKGNYEIVFAIDANRDMAYLLENKYGKNRVFVTGEQNGWGRGILRTIIHALDYFKPRIKYEHVITMDSDALCVGPFIDIMIKKAETPDVFFVGSIWHSPGKDHGFHFSLRSSGFMNEYPFKFKTEMAAGPCMLWTSHCFKFLKTVGLLPSWEFDKRYNSIHFAHDQLSTWLYSCGVCQIERVDNIMEIKWRESLPTFHSTIWGNIPITYNHTAIIHPTQSDKYTEDKCREYFRQKRLTIPSPPSMPIL